MSIDDNLAIARSQLERLQPADAYAASADMDTYIIDTRPEFQRRQAGEIPGSIVIERNHLEWRLDPSSSARIPEATHREIRWIVICEGGFSSSLAAESLHRIGLSRSTDVIDGFIAWAAAGLPVVHPQTPSPPRLPG